MKNTRLRVVTIIGVGICAMLMAQGSRGREDAEAADTDQGTDQPSLSGSRVPKDMVLIPGGTNAGTDPDSGAYSRRWIRSTWTAI